MADKKNLGLADIIEKLGIPWDIHERLPDDVDHVLETVLSADPGVVYDHARLTRDRKYLAKARSALVENNPSQAIDIGQLKRDRTLLKMAAQAAIGTEPECAYWVAVDLNDHPIMLEAFKRLTEVPHEFDDSYTIRVRYDFLSRNNHRRERAALHASFVKLDADAAYEAAHIHNDAVLRRMAGNALLAKNPSDALDEAGHYKDVSLKRRAIVALFKSNPHVAYDEARALRDSGLIVRAQKAFVNEEPYVALRIAEVVHDPSLERLAAHHLVTTGSIGDSPDSRRDLREAYKAGMRLKDKHLQTMAGDALVRSDPLTAYKLANDVGSKSLRLQAINAIAKQANGVSDIVRRMYS